MTSLTRDRDYATFVEDERSLLQRCAYLLVGLREAADELGLEPGVVAVASIKSTNVVIGTPGIAS